jgi:hypothetical protein
MAFISATWTAVTRIGTGSSWASICTRSTRRDGAVGLAGGGSSLRRDSGHEPLPHDQGERLGDVVLVATTTYVWGRVVVWGDTSAFQDVSTYYPEVVSTMMAWPSRPATWTGRPTVRVIAAPGLIAVLVWLWTIRATTAQMAVVAVGYWWDWRCRRCSAFGILMPAFRSAWTPSCSIGRTSPTADTTRSGSIRCTRTCSARDSVSPRWTIGIPRRSRQPRGLCLSRHSGRSRLGRSRRPEDRGARDGRDPDRRPAGLGRLASPANSSGRDRRSTCSTRPTSRGRDWATASPGPGRPPVPDYETIFVIFRELLRIAPGEHRFSGVL